ncbi:aminotransferase [Lentinula edodes]|nr:aminotransferase [Lentinula edodes]
MSKSVLSLSLEKALQLRRSKGMPTPDLLSPQPLSAPDFFSNDYLSLTTNPHLRRHYLDDLACSPLIYGAGSARLIKGNTSLHVDFENRMKEFFGFPAALLFNSGYQANVAFFSTIPQAGDVIIFDTLIHASVIDGISTSRVQKSSYAFAHNSVSAFRSTLLLALQEHPEISLGCKTIFVAVESIYSMDGDFAPLPEIVAIFQALVPEASRHIVVDEAHTTAVCGDNGKGYVHLLGLENDVHTVLHTFGKARGFSGAVILSSEIVRLYLISYARSSIYTTAPPCSSVVALNTTFDFLADQGMNLIQNLQSNAAYFESQLTKVLKGTSCDIITSPTRTRPPGVPANLISPIFPILTPFPNSLAQYLCSFGYAAVGIPYPAVPKGQERIRLIIHTKNTQAEMDCLITRIIKWAAYMQDGKELKVTDGIH